MHLHNYERGQSIRFLGKRRRSHQQKTEYRVPKTENSFLLCATDKRHIAHVHVHVRVMSWALDATSKTRERERDGVGALGHWNTMLRSYNHNPNQSPPSERQPPKQKACVHGCVLEMASWEVPFNNNNRSWEVFEMMKYIMKFLHIYAKIFKSISRL